MVPRPRSRGCELRRVPHGRSSKNPLPAKSHPAYASSSLINERPLGIYARFQASSGSPASATRRGVHGRHSPGVRASERVAADPFTPSRLAATRKGSRRQHSGHTASVTVYAIANHLSGPREVVRLPVSHTNRPEEKLWDRFEAYGLRLATRGVPQRTSERTENDCSRRSRGRRPDLLGGGDTALAHPPPKVTSTPARAMTATTEMAVAMPNSFAPVKVSPRL